MEENTTVSELKYAKGWTGRWLAAGIRIAHRFLKAIGKKSAANTLEMGVFHLPIRALAKFGGMNRRQMEGLLLLFNGHLITGLKTFFGSGNALSCVKEE